MPDYSGGLTQAENGGYPAADPHPDAWAPRDPVTYVVVMNDPAGNTHEVTVQDIRGIGAAAAATAQYPDWHVMRVIGGGFAWNQQPTASGAAQA